MWSYILKFAKTEISDSTRENMYYDWLWPDKERKKEGKCRLEYIYITKENRAYLMSLKENERNNFVPNLLYYLLTYKVL